MVFKIPFLSNKFKNFIYLLYFENQHSSNDPESRHWSVRSETRELSVQEKKYSRELSGLIGVSGKLIGEKTVAGHNRNTNDRLLFDCDSAFKSLSN